MKWQKIPFGAVCLMLFVFNVSATVRYVDLNCANATPPYATWATAATNIQDAVDAANPGDQVLVTNGVYQIGGKLTSDGTTNRVAVTNAVTLKSVSGSTVTLIDGGHSMRCVYLIDGAMLSGFTLTNGTAGNGGGVCCATSNAWVSGCLIISNSASYGGGAYFGTLTNCTLKGNSIGGAGGGAYGSFLNNCILTGNKGGSSSGGAGAFGCTLTNCTLTSNNTSFASGGGANGCTLFNCLLTSNGAYGAGRNGGGAYNSILNNCTISQNHADYSGGGAYGCTLTNCIISSNGSSYSGGGITGGTLNNCVLTGNYGNGYGGAAYAATLNNCTLCNLNYAQYGGGANSCTLNNCIIYYNQGQYPNNYGNTINYCCTPDAGDVGCITNAPIFVNLAGNDFHQQTYSPCINAGNNMYVVTTNDLDGNQRTVGGTVDIGAYENQTATLGSGLPSIPTNFTAVLLVAGQVQLKWSEASKAATYNVKRAYNSGGPFTNLATGLVATNYVDSAITNGGTYVYLVTAVNAYGETVGASSAIIYVVHHFAFAPVPTLQTASVPFTVSISACDSDGLVLSNFSGAAMLSAAGDRGPVSLSPLSTAAFASGQWIGAVTIDIAYPDTNIRLTANSNGVTGISGLFIAVAPPVQQLNLTASDLVYDCFARRIYASVPATGTAYSNQLVVIDPVAGRVESSFYLGDDPVKLALSDDGRWLYAGFTGSNVFRRYDMATRIRDLEVGLGQNDYYGWPYFAADIAILPGLPRSIAITRAAVWQGYDPTIVIFDDGTQRSNVLAVPQNGVCAVEAATSSRLYVGGYFYRVAIDPAGIATYNTHDGLMGYYEDMRYQGGRVYTAGGTVINAEAGTIAGRLPAAALTLPDLASGRIYTLSHPSGWMLHACNTTNFLVADSLSLPGFINNPGSLIRWGTNGLAFRTSDNKIWLIRTSIVPSGPVATPSLTGGKLQPSGIFQLNFVGNSNAVYGVWGSTNFAVWNLLGTGTPSSNGGFQFVDADAASWPQRFYKAGTPQ